MSNKKLFQRWLLALLLALGLGTVWGLVIAFTGAMISSLVSSDRATYESLEMTVDGQQLIYSRIGGNYLNTEVRTLDGQEVDQDEVRLLGGTGTYQPYRPPGVIKLPISWRHRLAGTTDYARPPAEWMFIRDAEPSGSTYLAGFDSLTKLPIGFIGREGFRQARPPSDECFDLGPHRLELRNLTSTGRINFGYRGRVETASGQIGDKQLAGWIVFLIDKGKYIREINLRERTVRNVADLDDLVSISITSLRLPKADDATGQEYWWVHRLLARCLDRLVLVNPFDGTLDAFPLPGELRDANFGVWVVAKDKLFLRVHRGYWERGNVIDVIGLNRAGEITREPTVRLTNYVPGDPRVASLGLAVVGPSPVAWLAGVAVAGPCEKLQHHKAESYLVALRATVAEYWPGMLITIVVSILSAWFVFRLQRQYRRPNTRLWSLTMLVTGVPGLLAYWALHRGPPLENCPECRESVPRNRDACAHCEKPFAEPALRGTEIFA